VPWKNLFQPAIKLCEEGYTVEKALSGAIAEQAAEIKKNPNMKYKNHLNLKQYNTS